MWDKLEPGFKRKIGRGERRNPGERGFMARASLAFFFWTKGTGQKDKQSNRVKGKRTCRTKLMKDWRICDVRGEGGAGNRCQIFVLYTYMIRYMGVGEQHEQGRPKWIPVRQNGLSNTWHRIDCIIFISKVYKSRFYGPFFIKSSIFLSQIVHLFCILSYFHCF